jgi:hypothetical protein
LSKQEFADLLIKDLPSNAFRESQLTWVYGKVDDSWILMVQNKNKSLFQNGKVYGSR